MQAVILAAGLGSRLKDKTQFMPKGFIEFDGTAIVETSIKKLIKAGIAEIIIGTGHCAAYYEDLAKKYPIIKTIKNPDYANTGSMATLDCCAGLINQDFLLLESDLIYDYAGLLVLINDRKPNIVLSSGATNSGDEVYIQASPLPKIPNTAVLEQVSKKKEELGTVFGELVGISKLSLKTLTAMRQNYAQNKSSLPKLDYEKALADISCPALPIFVRKIDDYAWREIDDDNHLHIAQQEIYPRILEREALYAVKREVLLNPGPATTTDSVKYAQVCPDICPREEEFGEIMGQITKDLSSMAGKGDIKTVLFGGSGTAVDEAMISSCVPKDGRLLIVNNGAYGARIAQIASIYQLKFEVFNSSSFAAIDVDVLKKVLLNGKFTHLAIVYHETTTGLLNPVPEICRFCRQNGIVTIVDAVSAFAAIPIDMYQDGIDFMSSTSNKNIQGMAGVAFVFCQQKSLERIKDYPPRNFYLDLYSQYIHFEKTKQTRFTPPVQTLYALRQAIIETKVETIPRRYERYIKCWQELVKTVKALGLEMLVPIKDQSKLITAIVEPASPSYDFGKFHSLARLRGFTIYPGKHSEANTFRIANIGDIQPQEMKEFCVFLKQYMEDLL
ncbi:MAG: 2-aminoethylphosphonate--pyruvate transaminase [Elusimicrobiota bacterium]|jgi:2-aminoethylphosphonate-pyruvate transaminase|nr:2-aminoethylphosphonate--pyruvate transaminase [Elusimicrobiota bacterium]